MAAKYAVVGASAGGTAPKTILTLIGASTVRGWIYDILVGCNATPADTSQEIVAQRFTAAGTAGSSPTGRALDPANAAALVTCGAAHSAEPTYTASTELLDFPLNQRATFRWVAAPGGELVVPATASNGIGLKVISGTAIMTSTIHWEE